MLDALDSLDVSKVLNLIAERVAPDFSTPNGFTPLLLMITTSQAEVLTC